MQRLAVAILLALSACNVSNQAGRELAPTAIEQVVPGLDRAQVRALLGEPQETAVVEDGVNWRYSFEKVNMTIIPLLGGANSTEQAVRVSFGPNGRVTDCVAATTLSANGVVNGGASGTQHIVHCKDVMSTNY